LDVGPWFPFWWIALCLWLLKLAWWLTKVTLWLMGSQLILILADKSICTFTPISRLSTFRR
jgi:hypothetical protein